eukprot:5251281-Pyramimonas_sp.AAC.1
MGRELVLSVIDGQISYDRATVKYSGEKLKKAASSSGHSSLTPDEEMILVTGATMPQRVGKRVHDINGRDRREHSGERTRPDCVRAARGS